MTYQGQPKYVLAGFRTDVYGLWRDSFMGDEWGGFLESLLNAAERAVGLDDDKALTLTEWIEEDMVLGHDNNWWNDDPQPVGPSSERCSEIVEYWRQRSTSFKSEQAFEEELTRMPKWLIEGVNKPKPQDDPEWAEYQRLLHKFSKLL